MSTQSNGSPTYFDRRHKACREPAAGPAVAGVKKIRLKNNISAPPSSITATAVNCSFPQGKMLLSSSLLISVLFFCASTTSCGSTHNLSRGVKQQQQQVSHTPPTPPLQPNSYNDTKKSSSNPPRGYFYYNASTSSLPSTRNRISLEMDREETNNRSKEKEDMDSSLHRGNVFISLINDNDDAILANYKPQKQPSTTTETATTIAFAYNMTHKTSNMTSFTNGTLIAFPGSNATRLSSGGVVSLDLPPSPFSGYRSKFTVDELLEMRFEHRISNDIYMDPCKAGGFLDDIALPNPENERELQLQNIKDALYLLNHPEKLQEKAPSRSTYHKLPFPDDSSTSPSRASAGDAQELGSHDDDTTKSDGIRPDGDNNSENPQLFLHPRVSAVISSAAERRGQQAASTSESSLSTSEPHGNGLGTETLGNYTHEINNLECRNTSRNRPHSNSSNSRRRGRKRNHRKHHGHHHEGSQSHRHFSGLHHERNLRLAQERLRELERLSETPISSSFNSSNFTLSPPLDLLRLSLDNHYHELEALEEKSEDDEVIEQKKFLSEQIEVFNKQLSVNSDLKLLQSPPDLLSMSGMQGDQPHEEKIGENSLDQQEYQDDGGTSYSVDHSRPNVNKREYRLPPPYDKTYSSASSKNREHRRNRYGDEDPLVHEGFLSQIDRSHDNLETSPEKKLEMSTEEPYEDENKSKVDKSISSHAKVDDHPDKFSPESELMIIRKNNLRKARLERRKHRKFHRESAKKSKRAKILNKPPKESKYSSSQAYYNDRGEDIYDEYGRRRSDRRGDIYNNYFSEDRPYDGYSYKDAHGRNQFHNNRLNDSDQHQSRSNGLDGGLIPFYSSEKLRGKLPDSFYEKEQFEVPQQRGYFTPNEQESNKEEEPKLVNKEHSPGSIMRRKLARRNHRVKSHSSRRYPYPWEDTRRKNRNSRRKNRDRSRRKNKNRNHSGRWNRKGHGDRNFDRNYDSDEFARRRGSDRPGDRHDYGPLGVPWEKKGRDRSGYRREDDNVDEYGIHDNRRDHTRPDGLDNMGRLDHRELDRGMRRLDDVRDRDLSRTDQPDKYHRFDQRDPLRPLDNRDSFRPGDHRDVFHDPLNRPGVRDPLRPGDPRDPFRPDDHIDPLRTSDHRNPLRLDDHRDPFRPDDHRDPFRPDDHRDPLRPDDRRDPFRPIDHRDPLRPDDHRDPYNMDNHRDSLRPDLHNDPYRINEDRAILHTAGHIGDPFRTNPASFSSDVHDVDPFRSDVERDRYRPDGGPRDPFRSDGTRDPYRTGDLRDRSDLMDPYRRDSHRSDYQRELTWSDDPKSYPKGHTVSAAPQPTLVPSLQGDDPHALTKSLENGASSPPDLKQTTDSSNGTLLTSANKSNNDKTDITKLVVTNSTAEGYSRDARSGLLPLSSSARSTNDDLRLKVRSVGQRIAQRRRTRAARDRRCPNQKRCPGKSRRSRRAATARKERVWDFGVIPYIIDANFTGADKGLFKRAMRHWENYTCVKFVEKTDDHPNYIIFTVRECGCCSFVGKRGNGPQAISIGKNCDKFGIVVHELGHVVGFWHEHTRPDRENHVEIIRENIQAGQDYNFNKLTGEEVNSLGQRYDFGSIMHYARATFAKATYLDTIRPRPEPGLDSLPEIGQRVKLSEGDISQTNLLYKCPKCGRTFQDNSGELRSPLYPNASPPPEGERCEWRITATHGEKIVLNITSLDIFKTDGCKTDYLEIRDGVWHKDPLLGRLCGSLRMPRHLVSHGSRLLVTYVTSQNQNGHRGFDAHYEAVCGGELAQEGGHLESPNYPDDYRSDKECVWLITVPDGFQVALRFHSFEIENHDECVYDYLDIRDGHSENDTLIGVFCGYKTPEDVKSKGNKMRIKFVTDGSVQKAGFSATFMKEYDECSSLDHGCEHHCINQLGGYECQCNIGYELHSDGRRCEDACGGQIESSNGSITSPSFPDLYPINKNCIWEIMAPPQYRITLNFTHFDLEGNNQDCEYDSVEIRSRMGDTELRKHGIYCGQQLPPVVTSDGNSLRVEFTSDNSVQKSGFAAVYFTDKDECASDNGGCQHICKNSIGSYQCSCHNGFTLHENGHDCKEGGCKHELTASIGEVFSPNYPDYYPSRKNCVWHFTTTPGHRIKLVFDEFEMEPHQECTYDYIIIFDGTSPKAAKLGRYCGAKVPHPIVASTNQMFMIFKSDSSVQRKGFRARHTTVCGGHLQAGVGAVRHMYSHAKYGDQNYDNKEDCDWIIEAPSEKNVHLTFLTFEVEDEHDCGYDYVEVFSGYDDTGPSYGKFCGNSIPQEIVSINEALLVRFRSDDTINTKGFSAAYVAIHEEDSSENTTGDQSTFSYSFSRGYK